MLAALPLVLYDVACIASQCAILSYQRIQSTHDHTNTCSLISIKLAEFVCMLQILACCCCLAIDALDSCTVMRCQRRISMYYRLQHIDKYQLCSVRARISIACKFGAIVAISYIYMQLNAYVPLDIMLH
jgi:hypothetical protein